MSPKDMTNEELFIKTQHRPLVSDTCEFNAWSDVCVELLYRLNKAYALRKENEELRNLFGECPKRNNRLGTYSDAKPVQIDVCKLICMTKESEASHD